MESPYNGRFSTLPIANKNYFYSRHSLLFLINVLREIIKFCSQERLDPETEENETVSQFIEYFRNLKAVYCFLLRITKLLNACFDKNYFHDRTKRVCFVILFFD